MKIMHTEHIVRTVAICRRVLGRSVLGPLVTGLMVAAALVAAAPRTASAQDRVVGREALDPKDRENLPPAIDGRADSDEDVDPRALEEFREPLAPHGAWIDDPTYGTIWVPDARVVGPDFTPYQTAGRWELTTDGDWMWVSDYSWGDIPFHYGRWVWVDGQGWAWIPGRVWAPAWVVWRTGPYGYVGWGPCPPTWGWYGGSAVWLWWPPPAPYWFVETRYVFVNHVHTHIIREPARVANAARQTTPLRKPASPAGGRGLDGHRPAHPDFDQMRYEGSRPTQRPARPHPEVGIDRSRYPAARAGSRRSDSTIGRGEGAPRGPKALGSSTRGPEASPRGTGGPPPRSSRGAPRGSDTRDAPTRAADRDARPTARTPSSDAPSGRGRDLGPSRDVAPSRDPGPSRDVAPSRDGGRSEGRGIGGSSPSRPASPPPPAARKPSTAAPAPAPARGPNRSTHRGRR